VTWMRCAPTSWPPRTPSRPAGPLRADPGKRFDGTAPHADLGKLPNLRLGVRQNGPWWNGARRRSTCCRPVVASSVTPIGPARGQGLRRDGRLFPLANRPLRSTLRPRRRVP
jgi:hypothetical protein